MGLIILTCIGALLGWLAAIILRREANRDVLSNVAAGVLGAVLGGALASSVSILSGLSATALLLAVVAAAAAIGAFNLIVHGTLSSSTLD